jgi:hypothetical protein
LPRPWSATAPIAAARATSCGSCRARACGCRRRKSALATYLFNKHVIKHHFCPACGCAPFGFGTGPDGKAMAAVNVRCLEGVEPSSLKIMPFDGRSR